MAADVQENGSLLVAVQKSTEVAPLAPAPVIGDTTPLGNQLVVIEVVCGGMTKVEAPVAVVGCYTGLDLGGPSKAFDLLLDSWLSRAIELGMIGTGVGQL